MAITDVLPHLFKLLSMQYDEVHQSGAYMAVHCFEM